MAKYTIPGHEGTSAVMTSFQNEQSKRENCDVLLKCFANDDIISQECETIHAHRRLLVCYSPWFSKILAKDSATQDAKYILPIIDDAKYIQLMIRLIYEGCVFITDHADVPPFTMLLEKYCVDTIVYAYDRKPDGKPHSDEANSSKKLDKIRKSTIRRQLTSTPRHKSRLGVSSIQKFVNSVRRLSPGNRNHVAKKRKHNLTVLNLSQDLSLSIIRPTMFANVKTPATAHMDSIAEIAIETPARPAEVSMDVATSGSSGGSSRDSGQGTNSAESGKQTEDNLTCHVCGRKLANKRNFERHVQKRHPEQAPKLEFKCLNCDASFAEDKLLHSHYQIMHGLFINADSRRPKRNCRLVREEEMDYATTTPRQGV